jgi:hypothetical protein
VLQAQIDVSIEAKRGVYNGLVLDTLLFGAEHWALAHDREGGGDLPSAPALATPFFTRITLKVLLSHPICQPSSISRF